MNRIFNKTLLLLLGTSLITACTSTKVLENRENVPKPTTQLPQKEKESKTSKKQTSKKEIPTFDKSEFEGAQNLKEQESPQIISTDFQKDTEETKSEPVKYKVKKGDSFWKISRKYGVGMKELAAYNDMDLNSPLRKGTTIEIPPGGKLVEDSEEATTSAESEQSQTDRPDSGTYKVQPGDSLWTISRKFNTSIKKLAKINNVSKDTTLNIGQKLKIPEKGESSESTSSNEKTKEEKTDKDKSQEKTSKDKDIINNIINDEMNEKDSQKEPEETTQEEKNLEMSYLPHNVREGDSWKTISQMYGISIEKLKNANPKYADNKELKAGTVIKIPE